MSIHQGGCLCGALRYETNGEPARVTYCHCKFCQRATGGAYLVGSLFSHENIKVTHGKPKIYTQISSDSGKAIYLNFCENCGTKIFMTYERFEGVTGVYSGTFDDPNWFARNPENTKHIYLNYAQTGSFVPAGLPAFAEHAANSDGSLNTPEFFDMHHLINGDEG